MDWQTLLLNHWHVALVCGLLVWAAWIDGRQLRVPNWLTFPMILTGLIYQTVAHGWGGVGAHDFGLCNALIGMVVGLGCLLPLYAVGGMGAGDVKLMAGVGAWLGWEVTLYGFCATTIVGAVMAVVMTLYRRSFQKHYANFLMIFMEWMTVKDPRQLAKLAAERKPTMLLLPYGIPICIGCIGCIGYMLCTGQM